jgi:DNA/RNA endonuclease G (NUC1)
MLTAAQEYHWAVEVTTKNGSSQTVTEEFQTSLPEPATDNPFTSVTVLTPGIKVQNHESINVNLWATARQIQDRGGEVLRYQPITSQWQSVTYNPSVRDWVVNENQQQPVVGKPLVLLADWINGIEPAKLFNSGFAEAAADAMFASLVQLDQKYDGTVGGVNGLYDQNGNLIRQQGDIFNSPLHFIGIGQGAVVNTEMIQRLGTYFPNAGGTSDGLPDIQMTTVDPHDYDENSPSIFQNIFDPEIVVWDNVTYADNYYQTNGTGNTLNGQELSSADWNVNLGSLVGFDQNLDKGGPHQTAAAWYAGTADLSPSQIPDENGQTIYRRLGDLAEGETPWYVPDRSNANLSNFGNESAPWEGIGTGWFNSVLGGGDELRPNNNPSSERLSVKEDNNSIPTMRGDYAVPTLFNGNFDSVTAKLSNQYIPGWSFSEGSLSPSSQTNLVEWRQIASLAEHRQKIGYNPTKSNYSLKLTSNQSITHDPFVVPDWGVLRLDLHLSESDLNKSGKLKVYLEEVGSADNITIQEISLEEAEPQKNDKSTRTSLRNRDPVNEVRQTYTFDIPSSYEYDKNTIGYGSSGFETFHFDIDPSLRGKVATLKLELLGSDETVYVDNVFFKSEVLKWGNPTEARNDPNFGNNFLIEKPQYSLSYNQEKNTINWVGWKLDKTWLGTVSRPPKLGFAEDPDWKKTGWYSVKDADYDALYLKTHDGQTKDNREGIDLGNGQVYPDIDARTGNYIPILEIDRGHMAPAAHRSRTAKDLYATFLTTNLIPQESSNNRGIWKQQEDLVRDVIINADKSEQLETYMFAGGFGYYDNPGQRPYTGISQNPELDPTIQFPLALWKVVLTKDKQSELPEYSHYGFYLGNAPRTVVQKQSIQNLETLLNGDLGELSPEYQFLSNVPESSEKEKIKRTIFERLP